MEWLEILGKFFFFANRKADQIKIKIEDAKLMINIRLEMPK